MKNLLSKLSVLLSPAALGIYLTCGFTWSAFNYFAIQGKDVDSLGPLEQLLVTTHQKSIDFRLKARGERPGSPQVGLLTVDDKAVATVGRWPWPRDVIAKAIENAVHHGAKVLAFDIVFSEPSAQEVTTLINAVAEKTPIPADIRQAIDSEITSRDPDHALGAVFAKNSNALVLGSFASFGGTPPTDQFDSCMNLIFSLSPPADLWTNREKAGIINLTPPPEIPETLKSFYLDHLKQIATAVVGDRIPHNALEQHAINSEIMNQQVEYCVAWLDPKEDQTYGAIAENWSAVAGAEGDEFKAKYPTFNDWVQNFIAGSSKVGVKLATEWTMNLPSLTPPDLEGFNTGYFNANQDSDGTVRRSHLVVHTGSTYMPSIAFKAFLVANKYNAQLRLAYNSRTGRAGIEKLQAINEDGEVALDIPVDPQGQLAINYAGKQKMFPYVSMAELLSDSDELSYEIREFNPKTKTWGEVTKKAKKAEFLKGKMFIVGATAVGIYDLRVTPFEENFPGAETHANVLDNLVRHDFFRTHEDEEVVMLVGLLVMGVFLSLALSYLGALPGLTLVVMMITGIAMVDRFFLFGKGTVVTVALPLALICILFVFLISYKYFTEERGKKELRSTFQKYVSPAIVEEILSDPTKIELGGRKARVTIFFSDVRGFTTISEKLDPRALSDLLNEYLTPMTDLVFSHRGTLDKYMGDAIMAFFGAPIAYPDHAKFACRCALQNIKKLFELQAEFKRKGLPEIDVGIGLNTGEVSVGNMGSQTVRSYTVMGDAVNLASRLEGTNKQYGTRVIISEFTYEDVKKDFICRELDWVRVKGKAQPVRIFELIAEGKPEAKVIELLKWYQEAYGLYHEKRWDKALDGFGKALHSLPTDPVTKLYIERCQEYLVTPPPPDWDGVFEMKTK